MKISLENIFPLPMKDVVFDNDSIWRNSCVFETGNDYLIIAPSGTGKTTLFSFIFGIRNDFEGRLLLDGVNIKNNPLSQWAELRKRKISLVPQDLKLISSLTVWENLELKNRLTGHRTPQQVRQMLAALGMENTEKQKCGTLSLGQQQRVSIIRALLQPFEFILLDEPFSHIDDENIKKAGELITNECRANGANHIMVSLGLSYGFSYNKKLRL